MKLTHTRKCASVRVCKRRLSTHVCSRLTPCGVGAPPDPRLPATRPPARSSPSSDRQRAAGTSPPLPFLPTRHRGPRGGLTAAPGRAFRGAEGSEGEPSGAQPRRPRACGPATPSGPPVHPPGPTRTPPRLSRAAAQPPGRAGVKAAASRAAGGEPTIAAAARAAGWSGDRAGAAGTATRPGRRSPWEGPRSAHARRPAAATPNFRQSFLLSLSEPIRDSEWRRPPRHAPRPRRGGCRDGGQAPGLVRSARRSARCPPSPPAPRRRRGRADAVPGPPRPLPGPAVRHWGSPTGSCPRPGPPPARAPQAPADAAPRT